MSSDPSNGSLVSLINLAKVSVTTTPQDIRTLLRAATPANDLDDQAKRVTIWNVGSETIYVDTGNRAPTTSSFELLPTANITLHVTARTARELQFATASGSSNMNIAQQGDNI